jgi:hypothetical protein
MPGWCLRKKDQKRLVGFWKKQTDFTPHCTVKKLLFFNLNHLTMAVFLAKFVESCYTNKIRNFLER